MAPAGDFRAPRGTYDVLPPDSERWLQVRDGLLAPARLAGYAWCEPPVLEDTALFARGVGESTDVVAKEMFTFADRGGRSLTLRPEGTAGVVRAVLEHGLHGGALPLRLRYAGPMFRAERPQAGRFRQFQQVGVEALGSDDPLLDAEVVLLAVRAFEAVGLRDVRLLLTSLGDGACRPAYRALLADFLLGLELDDDTRRRASLNPLRVLDDKRPEVARQTADAPLPPDHLCDACRAHAQEVREHLGAAGVVWTDAPRLVRGLDYYGRTTFELVHDGLGAQSAVGGGGRYDGLSESVGGPRLAGVGWALGVERTLLALQAEGRRGDGGARTDVVVVPLGDAARRRAGRVADELRGDGWRTVVVTDRRGARAGLKVADRSDARAALVLGDRDLDDGVVQLKVLATGEQTPVPLDGVGAALHRAVGRDASTATTVEEEEGAA